VCDKKARPHFPAHVMCIGKANVPLIDGGVVANNPTACAIAVAQNYLTTQGGEQQLQ